VHDRGGSRRCWEARARVQAARGQAVRGRGGSTWRWARLGGVSRRGAAKAKGQRARSQGKGTGNTRPWAKVGVEYCSF
jgi:hypothetical protein